MTAEPIPDDIMATAQDIADNAAVRTVHKPFLRNVIARAILAERNRVHKQLKGED